MRPARPALMGSLVCAGLALAAPRAAAQCEIVQLQASDAAPTVSFGNSVSMGVDRVVVGAWLESTVNTWSGAAYVYKPGASGWTEEAKLQGSNIGLEHRFGQAVSLDGTRAAVGAPGDDTTASKAGSVYVFERSGSIWSEEENFEAMDADAFDNFGASVSISGDSILVGAPRDDEHGSDAGAAYVFVRNGSSWSQQAKLFAGDAGLGDQFGSSVALDGDLALVGAPNHTNLASNDGAAYLFRRSGSTWTFEAKLVAGDAQIGDGFGSAVDVQGTTAVIGAPFEDEAAAVAGAVYVFEKVGLAWSQAAKLMALDALAGDELGYSVSLDQGILAAGAHFADVETQDEGAAYLFEKTAGVWSQKGKTIANDREAGDNYGAAVAVCGDRMAVGAVLEDGPGGQPFTNSGATYLVSISGADCSLLADVATISLATGGTQTLAIDAGLSNAGKVYWLLGTTAGTAPGIPLGPGTLPLNYDGPGGYMEFTLLMPNVAPLGSSLGVLSGTGQATATFGLPPGLSSALAGIVLHHAYFVLDSPANPVVVLISGAIDVTLVP